jgi:hypothetical protein
VLCICRLFKTKKDLQHLFNSFRNVESEDEIRADEALLGHATIVLTTLDEAISNMDNYDYVIDLLRKTGGTHNRFPGYRPDYFWVCICLYTFS